MMDWITGEKIAVVNERGNFYITPVNNFNKKGTDEYDRTKTLGIPDTFVTYGQIKQYLNINFDIAVDKLVNHTNLED